MKKKVLAKEKRTIGRLMANVDGKYHGLTQKECEDAVKHSVLLERACIRANYRSLFLALRKIAVKEEKAFEKNYPDLFAKIKNLKKLKKSKALGEK